MCRCPAHDDRDPSFSICDADDGKVLVYCHAGCDQERVITALRARGLWMQEGPHPFSPTAHIAVERRPNQDDTKRTEAALAIWQSAAPAGGTLVETYFASRGLRLTPPPTLRFHRGLKHPSGGVWPAMVALVTRGADGAPLAVHRTFLARDGAGKASVDPQRMSLGSCRGAVVQLAAAGNVLMVGEGIETCLSAMQATSHPAWAALSTSGLRGLDLPEAVRNVIVLADGDDPGEAAAQALARRLRCDGRRVRIERPPKGMDFNDLLLRGARFERSVR